MNSQSSSPPVIVFTAADARFAKRCGIDLEGEEVARSRSLRVELNAAIDDNLRLTARNEELRNKLRRQRFWVQVWSSAAILTWAAVVVFVIARESW